MDFKWVQHPARATAVAVPSTHAQDHGGNTLAAFNGSGAWMGPLKTYTGQSDAEWKKRMICPSNPRLPFGDGAPYATNYAPSEAPMGYKNSSGSFQMARAGRPSELAMISDGFVPAGQDENKTHYRIRMDDLVNLPQTPRNFFHHMGVNIAFHDGSVRHVAAKDVDLQWWGNSRQ